MADDVHSEPAMSDRDVRLLDIVPWTHGYAHSWALRWMLTHDDAARDALLTLFVPSGRAPWSIKPIEREHRIGGHRADLRVRATDASGHATTFLIETKVNDDIKEAQLRAYCRESAEVVVYAPGLTGLLFGNNKRVDRERWVTGRDVTDALSKVSLPPMLRSYLDEVAAQADRMDAARAAVRGERTDFSWATDTSGVTGESVEAVAWVAEVAGLMRARGAGGIWTRNTAHDYGVYWGGSRQSLAAFNDAGVFVEVIAQHGGHSYAITVKVGGGQAEDRVGVCDAARRVGPPWGGWRQGKRVRNKHFRLWTLNAGEMNAREAADAALRCDDYLRALAAS